MTNTQKQLYIAVFIDSIKEEMIEKIEKNLLPENWNGLELRQWCIDSFVAASCKMDKQRKKNYSNDVITNNL